MMRKITLDIPGAEDWLKPDIARAQSTTRKRVNEERSKSTFKKRLSRAFGNKKLRNAQLVSRLKRRRGYAKPVRGGTGKQNRSRRKKFAKHLPGQHDQLKHGRRGVGKYTHTVKEALGGYVVVRSDGMTLKRWQTEKAANSAAAAADKFEVFRSSKKAVIDKYGWDPFQDNPPAHIARLMTKSVHEVLPEGVLAWKQGSTHLDFSILDIADDETAGLSDPTKGQSITLYNNRNYARAMIEAIDDDRGKVWDQELFRGESFPSTVLKIGDVQEIRYVGTSLSKNVAEGFAMGAGSHVPSDKEYLYVFPPGERGLLLMDYTTANTGEREVVIKGGMYRAVKVEPNRGRSGVVRVDWEKIE